MRGQELPTLRWWIPTSHETVDGPHGALRQPVRLFLRVFFSEMSRISGDLVQPLQFAQVLINVMVTSQLALKLTSVCCSTVLSRRMALFEEEKS